jgi:hypothetical protein
MNILSLFKLIRSEPSPCDDCGNKSLCATNELACKTFYFFVNYGRIPLVTIKEPTREIYDKVFKEDEMDQIWEHIDESDNS